MKVRVSMPGAYMAVEMDEERAYRTFRKVTELLCISGTGRNVQDEEAARTEPMLTPACVPAPELGPEIMPEAEVVEPKIEVLDAPEPEEHGKMISIGYGGFLYIKCRDCGKIKGFCAKVRLSNFRCDCGSVTRLENLVPLFLRCECGRNARYLTNMEEPAFDVVCYDCGSPVAVEWNPKKKQYETIRGGAK